jgi:hypothetical protein
MIDSSTSLLVERVEDIDRLDAGIAAHGKALSSAGMSVAIQLGGCDPYDIRDPRHIERFVVALCELIEMRRFGDPIVVRRGADLWACTYSLAQLVETSLISGHFVGANNSAAIDIFSSKLYPSYRAAELCRGWFGATTVRVGVTLRQAAGRGTRALGRGTIQQLARDA